MQTNAGVSEVAPTPASAKLPPSDQRSDSPTAADKKDDAPVAFRNIDFKNFSYPTSFRKASIRLKNGTYEHGERRGGGGDTFDLMGVAYADLNGDGRKEAVVRLNLVACGGSCDGGSSLFYFYSIKQCKLKLLSRIEMGSVAYSCGLKSFVLRKRLLVLEAFRKCSFNGLSIRSAYDAEVEGNKFIAKEFTRLTFRFDRRGFVLKKRELLPNPDNDVKNYSAKISISND